jgi:hypothetical protein
LKDAEEFSFRLEFARNEMVAARIRYPTSAVGDCVRKLGVPLRPRYYRSFSSNFLLMFFFVYTFLFVFSLVWSTISSRSFEVVRIAKVLVAEPLLLIVSACGALAASGMYWRLSRTYKLTQWHSIEIFRNAA